MRRRTREYELPPGAVPPTWVADAVVAARRSVRLSGSGRLLGGAKPPNDVTADWRERRRVLDRAKAGDAAAIAELWRRWKVKVPCSAS